MWAQCIVWGDGIVPHIYFGLYHSTLILMLFALFFSTTNSDKTELVILIFRIAAFVLRRV